MISLSYDDREFNNWTAFEKKNYDQVCTAFSLDTIYSNSQPLQGARLCGKSQGELHVYATVRACLWLQRPNIR